VDKVQATIPEGEDCGFQEFFDSVDALVIGRKSYQKVLTFGHWPYGNKPVIVLSSNPLEIPDALSDTVSSSSESPTSLHRRLSGDGLKRLYIDGGITIQRFMEEGIISDLTITVIPVLLGSGIPLFGMLKNDVLLQHIDTISYDFGIVQLIYQVHTTSA
jgi:dihydrofolate reductase